ncbi:hypothetical protein EDB19DRAFT_1841348 [Suillus lakei]|nr:hypothetical protein EDB19DRAFT_1841348 [Suillus lakei]
MRKYIFALHFPVLTPVLFTAWASIFRHSLRRSRWSIRPLRASEDVSFRYLRYFHSRRVAYRTVQP